MDSGWELLETGKWGRDTAPKWVIRAANKHMDKTARRPYNQTKHFVGRTFVYRVYFKMVAQGTIDIVIWRKLRNKPSVKGDALLHPQERKPSLKSNPHNTYEYCHSCHRKTDFKEDKHGHFHCNKCGWRDPDDW